MIIFCGQDKHFSACLEHTGLDWAWYDVILKERKSRQNDFQRVGMARLGAAQTPPPALGRI